MKTQQYDFVCVNKPLYVCNKTRFAKSNREGRQAVDMGKKYTMNILSAHNSKIQQYYCELGYIHFPWK